MKQLYQGFFMFMAFSIVFEVFYSRKLILVVKSFTEIASRIIPKNFRRI
jgi:hypothetical protein